MGGIAQWADIARQKEFNYRVFVFAFLCLLAVYIPLLRCVKNLIELLRVRIINNYVGFETRLRTNSLKFHSGYEPI